MVNVVIDANREDPAVVVVMLQGPPSWEFHFWIHLSELARLRSLRDVNWTAQRSVQLGEDGAGTPVHWSINDDTLTALIGPDDETWHLAISMPLDTLDRLTDGTTDLLPPPEPPTRFPGQLEIFSSDSDGSNPAGRTPASYTTMT
ncbi:hypothetical protein ACIOBK_18645 [Micromonospora chokoriensis]